jgi:hypothetical protein
MVGGFAMSETTTTSTSSTSTLILSGDAYDNFVNTIKSDETLIDYLRAIKRFMRYLNITDINNL